MKRLLTFLVVLALIGYLSFKGAVWWLADQRLADAQQAIEELGVIDRGNIRSDLVGRLVLGDGSYQDFRLTRPVVFDRLMFNAGSPVALASFRPKLRSNFLVKTLLDSNIIVGNGKIPLGTQMVQLGAFSDKQAASQAWVDLSARYSDYFIGKANVILTGKIADQEIYRLRVYGFKDISESRRLCTALRGQKTECYPVVMN